MSSEKGSAQAIVSSALRESFSNVLRKEIDHWQNSHLHPYREGRYYQLPARQSLSASSTGYWWFRLQALQCRGGRAWNVGYGKPRCELSQIQSSLAHSIY